MVRAGCVFGAGIHPSRTWTSGSFESVRWNACIAQTRPRFILSSEGVFGGWSLNHVNSKGKIPSTENVPRGGSNPRRCGQRAQALPTELFRRPGRQFDPQLLSEQIRPWDTVACCRGVEQAISNNHSLAVWYSSAYLAGRLVLEGECL